MDTTPRKRKGMYDEEALLGWLREQPESDVAALIARLSKDHHRTIPAHKLTRDDALEIFSLEEDLDAPSVGAELRIPVSSWLAEGLSKIEFVARKAGVYNEASARLRIDQVLIEAIYHEAEQAKMKATETGFGSEFVANPATLILDMENTMMETVSYHGELITVTGRADYCIYYDKDLIATNLVAIEAKRRYEVYNVVPQLIAYMAMIHHARKQAQKEDCVIYGFASDGVEYVFGRIDSHGKWSQSMMKSMITETGYDSRENILGIMCSLIKAAAQSSPSASPMKDPEARRLALIAYDSPEREKPWTTVSSSSPI